jgi:flagellar biosynthesis chaperone FliJ
MARFRLASVLRARQLQEDAARGAVLHARNGVAEASAEIVRRERILAATAPPTGAAASAFIAAMCARRSMAGELSVAMTMAADAEAALDGRMADYTAASVRRRGVEKLRDRHSAAVRAAEDAAAQRELDDLAAGRHRLRTPS